MNTVRSVYHYFLAWLSAVYYRRPSRKLFVIGITGTKGKTTTVALMKSIFETNGSRAAALSSINSPAQNTMPGRGAIQKFLKNAVNSGCEYAVIEVTSQGVTQHRHRFIDWDAAVFLNISPEHIESHGSFAKYREAKLKFFRSLGTSKKKKRYFFINTEDQNAIYFQKAAERVPRGVIVPFSASDGREIIEKVREKSSADWLKADFNTSNVSAALAIARTLGIKERTICKALEEFKGVPGRMEFVQKKPFSAVVDYAHTPNSLEAVYKNLKENYGAQGSRLIAILGSAGGGRDKWKRPELGKVAANYADIVILTSEDPYDESPEKIIKEIRKGIEKSPTKPKEIYEITDRREAIKKAVSIAKAGDIVIATGMGSQKWFYGPKNKKIPWNEKALLKHKA